MSYGGYDQGGNPYGQPDPYGGGSHGRYGGNPYGSNDDSYSSPSPYGGAQEGAPLDPPRLQHHQASDYSSQYSQPTAGAPLPAQASPLPPMQVPHGPPMPLQDFLARINGCKSRIAELTGNITTIGNIHQRLLSSPDTNQSRELETIVTDTQILNTGIKDEIKFLEADAKRSIGDTTKTVQIRNLKQTFEKQLQEYQQEEANYRSRYREAIRRQYKIVNPQATEEEVQQAADANWGDEGVFQTALKTNRTGHATSVLSAVRARHNDIQRINQTLEELAGLFADLAREVEIQNTQVEQTEIQAEQVQKDVEHGNVHLDKGIKSARNTRKLKWICFWIVIVILCIIALALGLRFGLGKK